MERQIGINHRVGYRTPDINLDPPDEPVDEDEEPEED